MRIPAARTIAVTGWGSLLLGTACDGGGSRGGGVPLGWSEPFEAREVRQWSGDEMTAVGRWVIGDEPAFVSVPDSVEWWGTGPGGGQVGERRQRYVNEAIVLPDQRVVLLYALSAPDSILLHILGPASDEEVRIPAPSLEDGLSPSWIHVNMAAHRGEIILRDNNDPPLIHRGRAGMWRAGRQNGFTRPASVVASRGQMLGVFPDGSLVVMMESGSTDTTIVSLTVAAWPVEVGHDPADVRAEEVLFRTATPKDPANARRAASWAHRPRRTAAVAGDTIWIVPTEKPVLLAVHRSGDILLEVEWEAGDRSIPQGASDFWDGAARFPSAASLKIGTDGFVYVQRWTVREGRPVRGPEWLVFGPAGELLARLDVPGRWPSTEVLAFGDGAVVVRTRNDETGVQEIRVYAIAKSE